MSRGADCSIWSLTGEYNTLITKRKRYMAHISMSNECAKYLIHLCFFDPYASLHKHFIWPNQHQDEYQNQNDFISSQIKTLTL